MSAMLWKTGSEERLREHVIAQDKKFQAAMRSYLGMEEPKKPKRVMHKPAHAPVHPVMSPAPGRDVIDITSNADMLRQPLKWKLIIEQVCIAHQVTKAELLGLQRSKEISAARQEAMYRMKTETTLSMPQIAQRLGRKDHTTVLHGVRRHEARLRGEVYRATLYGKAARKAGL